MSEATVSRFSGIEVNWQTMELRRGGVAIPVKPKSFQLLEVLFNNRDRVVSKDELFDTLWQGRYVTEGALSTAVNELRRALGDTGKDHRIIRTYYGQGLRFVGSPDTELSVDPQGRSVAEPAVTTQSTTIDPNAKVTVGLAVLALDNLSKDMELDQLGETLAEDLITALSRFSQLSVVSRTSSFAVSHQKISLKDIAGSLVVDYIVQGSLRAVGDIAHITLQLIDAAVDEHVWSGQFDWPIKATSQQQFEKTGVIVGQLIDQITRYEAQLSRQVEDRVLSAWQCYYRGISVKNTHKLSRRDEAIAFFERAIAQNPNFALAQAVLSYALTIPRLALTDGGRLVVDPLQRQADLERAEKEALLSLEIDDRYPYAWVTLARKHIALGNPKDGLRAVQKAIDLNLYQPVALFVLAECLWSDGQAEEAIHACDRCVALGPSSVFYSLSMALKSCALIVLEQHEDAVRVSRDAQASSTGSPYLFFGEICALGHLGQKDEASDAIRRAQIANPGFDLGLFEQLYQISDKETVAQMREGFKNASLLD